MKCLICGKRTNDLLFYRKRRKKRLYYGIFILTKRKIFAEINLIEEFKRNFYDFSGKLIVFYPGFEEKNKQEDYSYAYVSLYEMKKRRRQEGYEAQIVFMENNLGLIKKTCSRCNNIANIAYFGQGVLRWKKVGLIEWDTPLIEEVTVEPETLCANCCIQEIEFPLKHFEGDFCALAVPYEENGMYFPRSY